jgi:peroxiredoxin
LKGTPSPEFNFENHKGGTTKLSDIKGKYVYIDIWATLRACRQEIPYLQKIEKKYEDKRIAFVSISIDQKIGL